MGSPTLLCPGDNLNKLTRPWVKRIPNPNLRSERGQYVVGPCGTGKTHVALGLGLAACQKGMTVSFTIAAALVNELMEARDERHLLRVQKWPTPSC
jgi:DNA replication protein DnaC